MPRKFIYLIVVLYFLSMGAIAKIIEVPEAVAGPMMLQIAAGNTPTGGAPAALTCTTDTPTSNDGSGNLSWTHTTSGTNRYLIVVVGQLNDGGTGDPTAVTFDGVDMTAATPLWTSVRFSYRSTAYGLIAPAIGAATVAITVNNSNNNVAGAISCSGVDQSIPVGTAVTANGFGSLISVTAATASGEYVIDGGVMNKTGLTVGADQDEEINRTNNGASLVMSTQDGVDGGVMTWVTPEGHWATGAIPIKPAN